METTSRSRTTFDWAGSALVATALIAIVAKVAGTIVAPGSRGVLSGRMVNVVELVSGSLAYVLMALLVALVCGASFELARARGVNTVARGVVVAISGLIVALASPAVVERLSSYPALALAVITSFVALVAGVVGLRAPKARAMGGLLVLLALSGLLRAVAWQASVSSFEHESLRMHGAARVLATTAVATQGIAVLLAGVWVGTRSKWRSRILANAAIVCAFFVTWLAGRTSESPSAIETMLHESLPLAMGSPAPFLLGSVAAFLLPWSILLAAVALLERAESRTVLVAIALALLSQGAFDIPLHALLVTASAQWAMLAISDQRAGVQQPMSGAAEPDAAPIE